MTTTPEQIDLWRQSASEEPHLEFKEAKTQFDNRRLYEYCVAIANEGGGCLLLGIADKPPRMGICEEKSSGIDRVIQAAEVYQLPAPDFRAGHRRTSVVIYGPRDFEGMHREDRVRACYQHCALRWVLSERMTNESLRLRFRLPEARRASVSQAISATVEAGLVKPDDRVGGSRKYARYLPFWA